MDLNFKVFEPLKENRFLITLHESSIPSYLFRNYKLYNEGETMIFETQFMESITYCFNPKDLFNITSVTLSYLDPTGEPINGLYFMVSGSNLMREQSYENDGIQITSLRFTIDVDSMKTIYDVEKTNKIETKEN